MFGKLFKIATVGWMALKWYRSRNGGVRGAASTTNVNTPFRRR
ncbi:MAG TPA: hypothetical protein VLK60_01845 [Variovorax sp.]|jgi:hypothetical protein|nr:hypothetical protein [Variovorax sp.]